MFKLGIELRFSFFWEQVFYLLFNLLSYLSSPFVLLLELGLVWSAWWTSGFIQSPSVSYSAQNLVCGLERTWPWTISWAVHWGSTQSAHPSWNHFLSDTSLRWTCTRLSMFLQMFRRQLLVKMKSGSNNDRNLPKLSTKSRPGSGCNVF